MASSDHEINQAPRNHNLFDDGAPLKMTRHPSIGLSSRASSELSRIDIAHEPTALSAERATAALLSPSAVCSTWPGARGDGLQGLGPGRGSGSYSVRTEPWGEGWGG